MSTAIVKARCHARGGHRSGARQGRLRVRPPGLRVQQRWCRAERADSDRRDAARGVGPDHEHRSPGRLLCMKYEIPRMLEHGGGAIVNTSSGAGVIGIKGSPAYTAAKHGVIGLTRAAALDYAAQNVRIDAICPGYIDTPMMARYTGGTDEGRSKVIAEEPIGRWAGPRRSARRSPGCARTRPRS